MLGIDIQETKQQVMNWISQKGVTYPVLLDTSGSVWGHYNSAGNYIPYNVVIDTGMIVRYSTYGYNESELLTVIQNYLPKVTAVTGKGPRVPESSVLFANYPNPVHKLTRFVVRAPFGEEFSVRIYDLQGRLVRQLARQKSQGRERIFEWNGEDDAEKPVPAGIYFAILRFSQGKRVLKILITK